MRQEELKSAPRAATSSRRAAVTTADIARHIGVSPATVSHVLNGRATALRIRPETQQRVLRAVEELGYMPNASARAVRTGRFGTVALFQSFRNVYLPTGLIRGVTRELEANDRHLVLASLPDAAFDDAAYLPKAMRELLADGLLINALVGIPDAFLEAIKTNQVPAIWVNVKLADDCIHPDDFSGGRIATEHLLALGHERIVFAIAGYGSDRTIRHYSVPDRYAGYEMAMKNAGRSPSLWRLPFVPGDYDETIEESLIRSAVQFLREPDRPTAIFAYEIETALPFLFAAADVGLRVPEDLSLVMCHSQFEQTMGRAITTVVHDMEMLGQESVRMLEEKMRSPDALLAPRTVPVTLIKGATSGPLKR